MLDQEYTFLTTNFVLSETLTLIRYHIGHAAAVQFWQQLRQFIAAELVEYVHVDETIEMAAWQIFERYHDQDFSFTDCTSFAVMRSLSVSEVFTADHHFRIMGFVVRP